MPRTSDTTHPRGFTFIEVMFAVLVLGVGVIMIAAMLPVAIRTAQETRESTAGSAAIEAGFHLIEQAHAESPFGTPGTPGLVYTWPSLDTAIPAPAGLTPFAMTFGNRVQTGDPTFMWIPFVTRNDVIQPPQVAMVGVRARNIEQFPTSPVTGVPGAQFFDAFFDLAGTGAGINLDNYPLPVTVYTTGGSTRVNGQIDITEPDVITLAGRAGVSDARVREAAIEGAAVVVVDNQGKLRVYRLSLPVTEGDADPTTSAESNWYLAFDAALDPAAINDAGTPGDPSDDYNVDEISVDTGYTAPRNGYLVGRMLAEPDLDWDDADNPHVGLSPVVRVLDGQQVR